LLQRRLIVQAKPRSEPDRVFIVSSTDQLLLSARADALY